MKKLILTIVIGTYLLIILHECAHAMVMALWGINITSMQIGYVPIAHINVVGISITLGIIPLGGSTITDKFPATWLELVSIYLAGPAINMLIGYSIVAMITGNKGVKEITRRILSLALYFSSFALFWIPLAVREENRWKGLVDNSPYHSTKRAILILGIFSFGLGIINLLPIIPFDGGQATWHTMRTLAGNSAKDYYDIAYEFSLMLIVITMTRDILVSTWKQYFTKNLPNKI